MIDLAATTAALYSLLRSDAQGTAARALLGEFPATIAPTPAIPASVATAYQGTAAVFPGTDLGRFAGSGVTYHWAVWRGLPVGGATGSMRAVQGRWWVYGPPNGGDYDLLRIATAIEALYNGDKGLRVAFGRCKTTVGDISPDASRGGARTLPVTVIWEALG